MRQKHTVTLSDGRTVDSSSEEWRAECEARAVLAIRTKSERAKYIASVERIRGKAAADALREAVTRLWFKS